MNYSETLKKSIIDGNNITIEQAINLSKEPLEEISEQANEIRKHFCGEIFDICTIINAKSGRCSEDCKYCAQSAHYDTNCEIYPLLDSKSIVEEAKYNADKGVLRYSLVTSGKNISDDEVEKICEITKEIKDKIDIKVCGSFGLLNENQYKKLYDSGLTRIHNNLETSRENFRNMCSTHTFDDKLNAISDAKKAGMVVCSGGIFGIGETMIDRIHLAFTLKEIGVKSIPVNMLIPVKGTPYESKKRMSDEEMQRTIAVLRFIIPNAFIRLAGGRGLMADKGRACFKAGANAAISGDMLTTSGISIQMDMKMINELGFSVRIENE